MDDITGGDIFDALLSWEDDHECGINRSWTLESSSKESYVRLVLCSGRDGAEDVWISVKASCVEEVIHAAMDRWASEAWDD